MYHHVPRCIMTVVDMWEAEPRLYWRVKVNGKWKFVCAVYDLHDGRHDDGIPPCTHPAGERVTLWWPTEVKE